jgi:hypothetical protein
MVPPLEALPELCDKISLNNTIRDTETPTLRYDLKQNLANCQTEQRTRHCNKVDILRSKSEKKLGKKKAHRGTAEEPASLLRTVEVAIARIGARAKSLRRFPVPVSLA